MSMQIQKHEALVPDPRLYWEGSVSAQYYYRDPFIGQIGPDNVTFVPPQVAPTPPALLAAYLAQQATLTAAPSQPPTPLHRAPARDDGGTTAHPISRPWGYTTTPLADRITRSPRTFTQSPYHHRSTPLVERLSRSDERGSGGAHNIGGRQPDQGWSLRYSQSRVTSSIAHPSRTNPPPYTAAAGDSASAMSPSPTTPFVPVPPPDVHSAARKDGHPVFPPTGIANAILHDVPNAVAAARADAWAEGDAKRVAAFLKRRRRPNAKAPREPLEADPTKLGVWLGVDIETRAHAVNLLLWSDAGCPEAWAAVLHIQQRWALRPQDARSEGIALVLSSQTQSHTRYFLATTGTVPLSSRAARAVRAMAANSDVEMPGPTPHAEAEPMDTTPIENAPADDDLPVLVAAFLGFSPQGDDTGVLNSRMSLEQAIAYWAAIPTPQWHKGMRNEQGAFPTERFDKPLIDDVRVVHTIHVFGPKTAVSRAQFTTINMTMFSCAGMFARFVNEGGYPFGMRAPEACAFEMTHFQWSHGANWWVSHGIALNSIDEAMLESFGLSWRNHVLDNTCPHATTFLDYPNDPSCTQSLSNSEIIPWENLQYPPLRPGTESTYPRKPAAEAVLTTPFASDMDFDFENNRGTPKEERTDWSDPHDDELGPILSFKFQ
ncbi:hypothetical protein MVEN_00206000 [Mycena venus]|uniref:Uncharacterized protein n=1 Tax=Mycena venus TaxID=2733690 RepID=A0A8H6Z1M7_9AGAR|nr:hypothetical protein MVEN_00206000 [Mycena venus]